MSKKEFLKLIEGFKKFRERYFSSDSKLYQRLASSEGQRPKTLIIGCSDSRVDPAIITSADPGELFVVRNVANLVPPYEQGGGLHGVSAAIEFAVINLKVDNIIVLGHRQCGGIRSLMLNQGIEPGGFVERWVQMARPARDRVLKKYPNEDEESLCRHGELESIITSIENLKTFPFVQKAISERELSIMGVYFDLEQGVLVGYDEAVKEFRNIEA